MGMNAACPNCGHADRSDNHRGARLGTCPECGAPLRAHTAGQAKGRYICPVNGGVSTHGLGHTVQLTEPMRLVFVPGWDDDRREPDPDRPGWLRPVTYHRTEPTRREQEQLDRAASRVFGPGCVLSGGFAPPEPGDLHHGKAGVFLLPAPGTDPAAWYVNQPVRYKKCAACPKRVVASDKTRIDHEWVPARDSYWQGSGWPMRRIEIKPGPHPPGSYACPDCRPQDGNGPEQPEQAAAEVASTTGMSHEGTPAPGTAAAEPTRGWTRATSAQQGFPAESPDSGYAAIHDAVARLAGVCDFAESQDGQGFNATDTWLGHALAAMPATEWTADQALAAWDMLRKYSGQLDGFGMPYAGLPRPHGAGELEEARRAEARERARQGARRWRGQQYRKARSYVRCDGAGEQVTLAFPYDPELVSQAKAIKGRSFDSDTKDNVYPFTSLPEVVALAEAHGIDIAPEVKALVPLATASAQQDAARPSVYTDKAGRVIVCAEYDPRLNEALKELNGGRSTWDRSARVHVAPIHRDPGRVLAIAEEFGLTVGDDARTAVKEQQDLQEHNEAAATAFEAGPVPIPGLAGGQSLKPQQYPVVRFAVEHRRVLIGDGMGWGKTLSSLAAVAADGAYPAVVVCRPSLTLNWVAEIRRFFPTLAVHEASGATPQPIPAGTDVIVIGSAALAAKPGKTKAGGKEFGWVKTLAAVTPKALIIDEGQDTKERGANRSQACEQLAAPVIGRDGLVLDLTGTAILNRPRELCQQLSILGRIGEFGGPKAFMWRYCLSETNEWGASYDGARNLIELHDRLLRWGIMIRRADDAKLGLPPCREHVLRIPQPDLDPAVMARYQRAEADLLAFLADQARQAAEKLGQDPTSAAVQATVRASAAEHLVAINTLRQLAGQAKRGHVTAWIGEHVAAGEKVMVAAHHRDEVDAYAAAFGGLKLQGGQTVAGKEAAKAAFQQQPAAQAPVIAVAIGAGGVGHTLTAAATGIQAEQAWTPGETQQMKKRLHRIGQDRPVDYYITVAAGTIDEHLWDVVTSKQATLDAVLDGKTDEGTDDGEASVAAELTWRLTQQGLGGHRGHTATPSRPGAPPTSAPAARRAPSVQSPAAAGDADGTRQAGPVAVDEPVTSLLLITGPREGVARETVRAALQPRFAGNIMLVTGGAAGVDTYAAQLWREWGGLAEEHRVSAEEWDRDPRGAGYARNARMVHRVTTAGGAVLAIDLPCRKPGCTRARPHNTHGTSHCAALAKQAGLPVDHYQAPAEPVTGAAHERLAVPVARSAATAAQDGEQEGGGTVTPARQPARVTRYTRDGGGQTLTVHAPRRGEFDPAAFTAFAAAEPVLGLDVETSALEDDGPRQFDPGFTVRLAQFGSEREAWVLNLADPVQRDAAAAVLADPARRFVTHTPFDVLAVWSAFGVPLGQRVADTHLLSKLVNPDERAGHGLKELSGHYLDDGLSRAEEVLHQRMWAAAPAGFRSGTAWQRWGWNHLPADDEAYAVYAGLDAIYVRRLLPALLGRCAPFAQLPPVETWLGAQATGISIRGLCLDRPYATALLAELEDERRAPEAAITVALGCPPGSPKFAQWLDRQASAAGITGLARTKTGQLETSAGALDRLLREHRSVLAAEVVRLVEARLAVARTSNVIANVRGFLAAADPDGRVHPQINTLRAKTARMSMTAPALQTLKKHDPRLRRCFRAEAGHVLISCDFAQVQTRVAAALAGDTALKNALASGDIHNVTAELMYGPGFTGQQRDISKRATYGTLFGGGAAALAAVTGVSEDAAREVINRWKGAYPGVTAYGQRLATLPEVITPSGRRIPADPARPYASANYVIQSTERDLLLAAVYRLVTQHQVSGLWLFMHDEVIVQAPQSGAERVRGLLQQAMTGTFRGVPILAEAKILGPTWGHTDTSAPAAGAAASVGGERTVITEPTPGGAPSAQPALFDATGLQASAPVSGIPAGRFDPAASDTALRGDGCRWLHQLLPDPQPPACETCHQPMRLPSAAPVFWACPACHPAEAAHLAGRDGNSAHHNQAGSESRGTINSVLDNAALAKMRADAKTKASPFIDPALLRKAEVVLASIDARWLERVVGHPVVSWRSLDNAEMLLAVRVAKTDAGHLSALAESQRKKLDQERQAAAAAVQAEAHAARAKWQQLRGRLPVPVAVQHNWTARHVDGYEQGADHIVVLEDLNAGRLRRAAGMPLCQTPSRAPQLRHVSSDADDERRLPDCKACLHQAENLAAPPQATDSVKPGTDPPAAASDTPGRQDPPRSAPPGEPPRASTPDGGGAVRPGTPPRLDTADDGDEDEPSALARIASPVRLRALARQYLRRGLLPVPAWAARENGECCCPRGGDCPRPGKHPRSVHAGPGPRDYSWKPLACHTPAEVDQRFADGSQYADANLMLAIPAGMMVIDQDNDDGGQEARAQLTTELGELPPTLSHQTPHGQHLIYSTPPGWTGRAWVGKDARNPVPAGIDLRMPGQILMAPPSRVPGPDGPLEYGPASGGDVVGLPATYLVAWTPPQPTARAEARPVPVVPQAAGRAAAYVHKTITGTLTDLASREPGGRNTAIYTAALKVGSVLGAARSTPGAEHAASGWTDETAEDAVMGAAVQNGYVDKHGAAAARAAIRSGLRNGFRTPRALPDFDTRPPAEPGRHPAALTQGNTASRHDVPTPGKPANGRNDPGPEQPRPHQAAAAPAAAVELRHRDNEAIRVLSDGQDIGRIYPDRGPRGTFYRAETASGPYCTATDREVGRHLASIDEAASAIIAARSSTAARPSAETGSANPERSNRMQANQAAIAGNEAYQAGDLDQARQHTDQAAALDPTRTGLWQQHRTQIAAKQLFLHARQAQADGHHGQAQKLIQDARQLDPRMQALWDRHLSGCPAVQDAPSSQRQVAVPGRRARIGPQKAISTDQEPRPRWPDRPALDSGPPASDPGAAPIMLPARGDLPAGNDRPMAGQEVGDQPSSRAATSKSPEGRVPAAEPGRGLRRVRADSVSPRMVVQNPYGAVRGRAVVASPARKMPDGTVEFDAEDGHTGHYRPHFGLDYNRESTARLAAEHETRPAVRPQRSPPTAASSQPERTPSLQPSQPEGQNKTPEGRSKTPEVRATTTDPFRGTGGKLSGPRNRQTVERQADAGDWRDTLAASERDAWRPRAIQPDSPFARADAKEPEAGS